LNCKADVHVSGISHEVSEPPKVHVQALWTSWDDVGLSLGGEGGIRTHGTLTRTTVFETVTFNHSATSPSVY
jgi:hypothetical protein